jgi:CBS domain-containing protein
MISRNGKIQELPRKNSHKRVKAPDDNRVEFEDVLDKESGKDRGQGFSKDSQHQNHNEERHSPNQALKAYQKNKNTIHSKLVHAKEICSRPVVTASPKQTVGEAIELMQKYRIHHLPLLNEEDVLMGMISDRDLIGKRTHERLERHATPEVLVAKEFTEIKTIAKMMLDNQISALPLIDENNAITGIITKSNLLEYIIKSMPFDRHI